MNQSTSNMLQWGITLALLTLVFSWFFQVYGIYFESTLSDHISLFVALLIGCFLGIRLQKRLPQNGSITYSIVAALIVIGLQPFIYYLLGATSFLWAMVHVLLSLCGLCILLLRNTSWKALPLASGIIVWFVPYPIKASQKEYYDRVVAETNTPKGFAQIVEWKDDQWIYYNHALLYSTIDQHMHAEAMVHPVMNLHSPKRILVIGGEEPGVLKELNKYPQAMRVEVIPYDLNLFHFLQKDRQGLSASVVLLAPQHILSFVQSTSNSYDLILIDLPIGQSLEFEPFATYGFLENCARLLTPNGYLVTKSYNPYLSLHQFRAHDRHFDSLGMTHLPYHTQLPTMGQSSWVMATKSQSKKEVVSQLRQLQNPVNTKWFNQEAMHLMLSFGKMNYFEKHTYLVNELTPH